VSPQLLFRKEDFMGEGQIETPESLGLGHSQWRRFLRVNMDIQ